MLIWLQTSLGTAALQDGLVRACDAQSLMAIDRLHVDMAVERQNLLDEAARQAEAELAAAREQAARILAEAGQDAERLRQRGYDEGMQKAMQDWHARGIEAAVDKEASLRAQHEKLAEIVSNAVERIVHSEDRATLYKRALKNVQALTRGATKLRLKVGPADHASALESIAGVSDADTAGLQIEVVADPSLRPGSCVFESDVGVLDASIETQLDALRHAMSRAVRKATTEEPPNEPPEEA